MQTIADKKYGNLPLALFPSASLRAALASYSARPHARLTLTGILLCHLGFRNAFM
jgi:hypothetical protein